MAIAVILDQRRSRDATDEVPLALNELNRQLAGDLRLPFVRTAGDEMQALIMPAALSRLALWVIRNGGWWMGVGIGDVEEPSGPTARESRGSALWSARKAVEDAKNRRKSRASLSVAGEPQDLAENLDAVLTSLAFILERRTARQWEAADLAAQGLNVSEIAARLGVTAQAVSQLLRTGGFEQQRRLMAMVDRLAQTA